MESKWSDRYLCQKKWCWNNYFITAISVNFQLERSSCIQDGSKPYCLPPSLQLWFYSRISNNEAVDLCLRIQKALQSLLDEFQHSVQIQGGNKLFQKFTNLLFASLGLAVAQRNRMDHLSLLSSQPPHATIDKTSICEAALGVIFLVVSPGKHPSDSSAESICSLCLLGKRDIDISPSLLCSGHSSLEGCECICKNFRQSQEWINPIQFREDSDIQGMALKSVEGLENITYTEALQKH